VARQALGGGGTRLTGRLMFYYADTSARMDWIIFGEMTPLPVSE
jgi:hypothetical protein